MLDPKTADALRQAVSAAQSGDMKQARLLAETALQRGDDVVPLNAFLGMLHARSGDLAQAVGHLKVAHHGQPDDITIACNLISAMIDAGDIDGAMNIASYELAISDPTLRLARYRGFLAQSLERFEPAVQAYEFVVERFADDFDSWNNLGNARLGLGDFTGSVAALERAVSLDPQAPPTRLNLAAALIAAGRPIDAEAVLRTAAEDFPCDARPFYELYVQLKRDARHEEALFILEQVVARTPDNAEYQLKLAVEYGFARRSADAQANFRKAIALAPLLVDAYIGLVIQLEHSNREDEFAPLIALAENNGLDPGPLAFMRALEHRRARRFEEGLEALNLVPADIEPERTMHMRAILLDRLGRTDEAFIAFSAANDLHKINSTEPLRRAVELREELSGELLSLTPKWASDWRPMNFDQDRTDPVFLVGFPRSGTTLLDTILMGHPGTTVLEEQPPLNLVDKAIGGLAALPALDEAGIARARAHYYEEIAKIGNLPSTSLLIDKSPLFLNKVPIIQRLFPNAKFILALRHPCDVVLSCYMSNFRLNSAMANFLRLEDAAEFYDLTFRYWERSLSLLPVNVHTIVYERLIENVEAEVRPLFDFLELDWHEAALDHSATAKGRGLITTASYSQVTEPIYKRAAGRWERYRAHLEPVLPILRPWVEKFGYSL